MPNEQALTESQWMWLQCQLVLDEHLLACEHCDALGVGPYCTGCGKRLMPAPTLCDQCHAPGAGSYCAQCGAVLRSEVEDAIDAGAFDWDAWAKSLQPFLGGLTLQEQAALGREGTYNGTRPRDDDSMRG